MTYPKVELALEVCNFEANATMYIALHWAITLLTKTVADGTGIE